MSLFFMFSSLSLLVFIWWIRYHLLNKIESMIINKNHAEWNYEKGFNLSTSKNEKDAEDIEKKLKSFIFGKKIPIDILLFLAFSFSFCFHFKIDPEYSNDFLLFIPAFALFILLECLFSSFECVVKERLYLVIRIKEETSILNDEKSSDNYKVSFLKYRRTSYGERFL